MDEIKVGVNQIWRLFRSLACFDALGEGKEKNKPKKTTTSKDAAERFFDVLISLYLGFFFAT